MTEQKLQGNQLEKTKSWANSPEGHDIKENKSTASLTRHIYSPKFSQRSADLRWCKHRRIGPVGLEICPWFSTLHKKAVAACYLHQDTHTQHMWNVCRLHGAWSCSHHARALSSDPACRGDGEQRASTPAHWGCSRPCPGIKRLGIWPVCVCVYVTYQQKRISTALLLSFTTIALGKRKLVADDGSIYVLETFLVLVWVDQCNLWWTANVQYCNEKHWTTKQWN